MKEISIVIPVYNVEKYLKRCVDSVRNQTFSDIEIILVDDGSTDKSGYMCDEFANMDLRIQVIHKANGGLSDARNAGLKKATGRYVLFVDSDDSIDRETCEQFIRAIELKNADIIVGNARKIHRDSIIKMSHTDTTQRVRSGKEYLEIELENNTMYMAAWMNLYKREFLISKELWFKKGRLHEDEEFTPRCFLKATTVLGTPIEFYNYFIRENSITTKKDLLPNSLDLIKTCNELERIYNLLDDGRLKDLLMDSLVIRYLNAFQIGKLYNKKNRKCFNKKFLKGKSLSKRNKIKVFLFSMSPTFYYVINACEKKINLIVRRNKAWS